MGAGFTLQTPNGSSCVGRISAMTNGITVHTVFHELSLFSLSFKNVKLKMSNKHVNNAN